MYPQPLPRSIATQYDAEFVIYRLEEAGSTLLSLPPDGYPAGWRTYWPKMVYGAELAYGDEVALRRASIPSAAKITRMDEAWRWLNLIPAGDPRHGAAELHSPHGGVLLRKIVLMRALVHPVTERHRWSWRKIGTVLGANHKSVKAWHAKGVDSIVFALRNDAYKAL